MIKEIDTNCDGLIDFDGKRNYIYIYCKGLFSGVVNKEKNNSLTHSLLGKVTIVGTRLLLLVSLLCALAIMNLYIRYLCDMYDDSVDLMS